MKFSIIIPTYNRAHLIEATIRSVMNSTYNNFEIIVIDDGSSDNTEEVVMPFLNDSISYYKIVNSERAFARNFGVEKAKGDYVTFLDSDDLFYQNHLNHACDCLQQNGFPEWFHCRYDFLDSVTNKRTPQNLIGKDADKKLIEGNFLSCQGVFISRDIALKNPFNDNRELATLEDWELWLRMAARYKLFYSNTITSALVQHENRSVMDFDKTKLIKKFKLFQDLVSNNDEIKGHFGSSLQKLRSSCNSYIALHLALSKENRLDCLKYFCISLFQNPFSVCKRRTLAIFKHFI